LAELNEKYFVAMEGSKIWVITFRLAMLPQEEVFAVLDQAVRDKLEEIADPANAAADAAAAGIDFDKSPSLETEKTPGNEEGTAS
jgi:hypothetical protein